MDFEKKLDVYAKLLITHGLNVQKGQIVNITGEIIHRRLIELLCQEAYRQGAKHVNVDFIDPSLLRGRILNSTADEYFTYVPQYVTQRANEFVDDGAAVLRLLGSEFPESLSDLDPKKINMVTNSTMKALKNYYAEGVGKSRIQWTVAAAATPKWGKKIFPELTEEEACEALWDQIFKICRVDQPDCLNLWKKHNEALKMRAQKLTQLKIRELHFKGPETDLRVFLNKKALFVGGGSKGPFGDFEPNIPTEECFTTPERNLTTGKVKITRPVLVNGKLVKGLQLEFKSGKLIYFDAEEGKENFAKYIDNDEGARYLGEVALVGTDSPIFQSGKVFEEILYDENAACHIALGFAYGFCLEEGTKMTPEELAKVGCNVSSIHIDMMISNEEVDVEAITHDEKKIQLIEKGGWIIVD